MLVKILNNKPVGYIKADSSALTSEYFKNQKDLIQVPDIEITEDIKYYEIVNKTLKLVSNFKELKEAEAKAEAERLKAEAEAERLKAEAEKPTFEEIKNFKLIELKLKTDELYEAYLSKYPEVEVTSFTNKANEAALVMNDNNISLTLTPYLTALTGNTTIKNRNLLAFVINDKVLEMATLESNAVNARDLIKACTTLEELEAIKI